MRNKSQSYWWRGNVKYSYKGQPIIFAKQCISVKKRDHAVGGNMWLIDFSMKGRDNDEVWKFETEQERDEVFDELKIS